MTHPGMGTKYRFRVKQGNRIIDNRGNKVVTYKPGDYLPDDYPKKNLDALVRANKVVAENMTMHPDFVPDALTAEVPGAEIQPFKVAPPGGREAIDVTGKATSHIPAGKSLKTSAGPQSVQVQSFAPPQSRRVGAPVKQQQSPWTLDPKSLQDKDLDQLNVMILERDAGMNPCTSVEEAIALLSLDYVGEEEPTKAEITDTAEDKKDKKDSQVATA